MNSMDNRLSHHNHQKSPNMFPKSCSARMSSFPFLGRSKNLSFSRCPIFTALAEGTSSTNTVLSAGVPSSEVLTFGVVEHAPPLIWLQHCQLQHLCITVLEIFLPIWMDQDEDAHDVQGHDSNEGKVCTHIMAHFVQPARRVQVEELAKFPNFTCQRQSTGLG